MPSRHPSADTRRGALGALFAAGFVAFSLLYSVQPLLPELAAAYRVSPAASSLALSLATAALALCMPLAAVDSDRRGRKPVMVASLLASCLLGLVVPFVSGFPALLASRLLVGAALAGVPAVAMAYVGEEFPRESLGAAMGLYVAGTALGGMSGRIIVGQLEGPLGWRGALAALAGVDLLAALWFVRALPPSRGFEPKPGPRLSDFRVYAEAASSAALLPVLGIPAFLMAAFVTVYNYSTFLLEGPPWNLTTAQVSWVFLCYLAGMGGSTSLGRLADRIGRGRVVRLAVALAGAGLALTLAPSLAVKIAGIAVFTFGYFGAHGTASGWAGERGGSRKGAAAALYLLAYYGGSSLGGWAGGWFWQRHGWAGVVSMVAACLAGALACSFAADRAGASGLPVREP